VKQITLRRLSDEGDVLEWAQIIKQVIRRPLNPQSGADIAEIHQGIRVLDALDRCDSGVLALEDSDWQHLCDKVRAMQWGVIDRRVAVFVDDVLSAHEVASSSTNGLFERV